jgi:hypothetical protein
MFKFSALKLAAAAMLASLGATSAAAQVGQVDPNAAQYEAQPAAQPPAQAEPEQPTAEQPPAANEWFPVEQQAGQQPSTAESTPAPDPSLTPPPTATVPRDDIFSAAEGVFGRGAEGLAGVLERILREQGEPIAYIAGQEAGGAFVFGVRYGSGTMRHRTAGDMPVYWTGPSVGFDFGAAASKVFVLVYNLSETSDLFTRFPGAEGNAYVVGGFTAQYLRRGNVVLIPVRLGVGLRLGVNAGYMRFSERNRWLPF